VRVGELVAVVENLFDYRDRPQHGIELHFDVALPHDCALASQPSFRVEEGELSFDFRWFRVSELQQVDVRPSFLRQTLNTPTGRSMRHIVHNDRAEAR
jgi:hypothetical protein